MVVTLTLPQGSTPDTYYKFQNGGSFEFLNRPSDNEGAEINGNVITLTLIDGGMGDADGVANGTIADPSAPGSTTGGNGDDNTGADNGGSGDAERHLGNGGCVMGTATGRKDPSFGLLLLLALMTLVVRHRRRS